MSYLSVRPEMKWQRQPRSVMDLALLGLLALLVVCLMVRGAWLQAQEAQATVWAGVPAGAGPAPAPRLARSAAAALHPWRPRPHAPPTWQQRREWARADLHSVCQEARQMRGALDAGAVLPFSSARGPKAAAFRVRRLLPALRYAAQEEAHVEAALGKAHGLTDIVVAYQEIGRIKSGVDQARSWFRARRMSGPRFWYPRSSCRAGERPPTGTGSEEAGRP